MKFQAFQSQNGFLRDTRMSIVILYPILGNFSMRFADFVPRGAKKDPAEAGSFSLFPALHAEQAQRLAGSQLLRLAL